MCTALNRVRLRRFAGLFNDNISTAKVNLPKVDEKISLGIKNSELIDSDFQNIRSPLTQSLHSIKKYPWFG
jgi:hypothetical protein